MKELSLHILDIIHNSIRAEAELIELDLIEDTEKDILVFTVKDDGKGMSPEMAESVVNPFTTSRTTRKVGLGIPMLKAAAELTGGGIELSTELGVGTKISATFGYSSIDRQPLGDMVETILGLVTSHEEIDFVYRHCVEGRDFVFDTREIKRVLDGVSFKVPEVMLWIKDFLRENEAAVYKKNPEIE